MQPTLLPKINLSSQEILRFVDTQMKNPTFDYARMQSSPF